MIAMNIRYAAITAAANAKALGERSYGTQKKGARWIKII